MGQMNFRKPSQTSAPTITEKSESQFVSTTPSSNSSLPSSRGAFKAETRLPEQKKDPIDTQQNSSPNQISISHSNNGHQNNAIENTKRPNHQVVENAKESSISSKQSKEVEEQANMVNANEVNTEDIVVPPPESFGNDDNHRALAAAALQVIVFHFKQLFALNKNWIIFYSSFINILKYFTE